jgi:dCMP deaminase
MNNKAIWVGHKKTPREVPSWDAYFTSLSYQAASRSKDPKRQVGAVIVSSEGRVVATGYNGFPATFPDHVVDWSNREYVRTWIVHAEQNALLHAPGDVRGGTLYCTLSPCPHCAKLVATAGIARVVVATANEDFLPVQHFLGMCGVLMQTLEEAEAQGSEIHVTGGGYVD